MSEPKPDTKQRWLHPSLAPIEVALVVTDLNPIISEPIRFGSLFGAQAAWSNIFLSALAFGTITFILDGLGAVSTANLLARKHSATIFKQTENLIQKVGLKRVLDIRTSNFMDFSIALVVGTPVTLIVKQKQDLSRSRKTNLRLGIILASSTSVVAAIQGGAIVDGVWHPNIVSIILTLLAIGSIIALQRWLKSLVSSKFKQGEL